MEVKNVVYMDKILEDLSINFDQTWYKLFSNNIMDNGTAKRVQRVYIEVVARDDKWQIIVVFTASFT